MSNAKRLMFYVVPVVFLSFVLNIPKFMEVTAYETNGTSFVYPTKTRREPVYFFWYTLSMIWHPTLTTGVGPFFAHFYMNTKIFLRVRETRKVRKH